MPNTVDTDSPLSPAQIAELERASRELDRAQTDIIKAGACGYDCRAAEAYRIALKERIDAVLVNYGNHRRRT